MTLKDLRSQVDAVDRIMLYVLKRRMEFAREISELKKLEGQEIIDSVREKEVLEKVTKKAKSLHLPVKEVQEIWKRILKLSHLVQQ